MEKYVISISRQFGSMGRPIARRLSELLGIQFYDRDIVEAAAKKMNLPVSEVSEAEEAAKNSFFRMSYPLGRGSMEMQIELFRIQKQIILDLADRESCIIVGRCSDYILKDFKNHLRVFIYAPYDKRLQNCVERLGMEEKEARRMITRVDKARANYHKTYAGFLPEDINYKDFLINSAVLGEEGTAKCLKDIVNDRFHVEE